MQPHPSNGSPLAVLQVVMDARGAITCHFQGPGRDAANAMLARAHQDLIPLLIEQEKKAATGVVLPDPGLMSRLPKPKTE